MKFVSTLSALRRGLLGIVAVAALFSAALQPLPARAAALSDYLENKLIDHVFRGTAYTAPATLYIALYTSSCNDAGGGTEAAWTSYARPSITSNGTNWANTQSSGTGVSTGTSGTTSNSSAINWATPGSGPTTVTHWGVVDASSGGNLLVCAALTASKTINSGDAVSFAAGALTVQIDN